MTEDSYSQAITLLERIDDRCAAFEAALLADDDPDPGDFLHGFSGVDRIELLYELLRVRFEHRPADELERRALAERFPAEREAVERAVHDASLPPTRTYVASRPRRITGRFGRYRIVRPLGAGGMGDVYLARDEQLGRDVALKIPRLEAGENPRTMRRFRQEARAAASVDHPNLCTVFDFGVIDGVPYLAMPYVVGTPLSETLGDGGMVPERQAAAFTRKLAEAIDAAHVRGIVHRDLKPANILVDEHRQPIVVDFGLAMNTDAGADRLTSDGEMMGTPAYMPPEQITGDLARIGPRSDVYSLGVVLYEMLAGRRPFSGPVRSMLTRIRSEDPPPPSRFRRRLDHRIEAICLRAMSRSVEDRYGSMEEFADALRQYLFESRPPDVPLHANTRAADGELRRFLGRFGEVAREGARSAVPWLTVTAVLAVAAAGGLWLVSAPGGGDEAPDAVADVPAGRAVPEVDETTAPRGDGTRPPVTAGEDVASTGEPTGDSTPTDAQVAVDSGTTRPADPVESKDPNQSPEATGPDEPVAADPDADAAARARIAGVLTRMFRADDDEPAPSRPLGGLLDFAGTVVDALTIPDSAATGPPPQSRPVTGPSISIDCEKLTDEGIESLLEGLSNAGNALADDRNTTVEPIAIVTVTNARNSALLPLARKLPKLKRLVINGKDFTDAGLIRLKPFSDLRELVIRGRISGSRLDVVAGLPNLERLDLAGSTVKSVGRLAGAPKLERLSLAGTAITNEGLEGLGKVTTLECLDLSRTSIGYGLKHIEGLPRLWLLNLTQSRVTDGDLAHLRTLPRLRELSLELTPVTNSGMVFVEDISTLRKLIIARTEVKDARARRMMQKLHADCELHYRE